MKVCRTDNSIFFLDISFLISLHVAFKSVNLNIGMASIIRWMPSVISGGTKGMYRELLWVISELKPTKHKRFFQKDVLVLSVSISSGEEFD